MRNLTTINLHDSLGDFVGRKIWDLKVESVAEAIRAIDTMSNGKLFKYLNNEQPELKEYEVIVNSKTIEPPKDSTNLESIKNSELMLKYDKIDTIDIIPSISGSDKNILGIVLIVVAVALIATGIGAAAGAGWATSITGAIGVSSTTLIVAGIGLAAAGAMILLSKPPKFEPFDNIDQGQRDSYLFNGPVNTVSEGGPVPIGYGELIIGSNTIAQNLQVRDFKINATDDFSSSGNGIKEVSEDEFNWAVDYVDSEEYDNDLFIYNRNLQLAKGARSYNTEQEKRLYWAKYYIYWYQVQQQLNTFFASDFESQYSANSQ